MLMIRSRCSLWKISTMSLALRSAAYQSNTFKKRCDDDDAAVRINPRVSLDMRKGSGKGKPRRPSRRNGGANKHYRVNVGHLTRIFPVPQRTMAPNTPSRSASLAAHQLAPPGSCNHHRLLTVAHDEDRRN
jgi:hypothetical protein